MGLSLDIACEQALRGALAAGREKDGEPATTSMRDSYWRRWHLVMMSLPLARVFQCLFMYAVPLCAEWRKSDSSVDGEPQRNWRCNSNSGDVRRFPFTKHFEKPPWKGPSREERVNLTQVPFAEMVSSPKFKMVAQISPWIAWNCWFLSKIRKWNMHFHWKVSKAKTGLRFQFSSYSLDFSSRMPSKSKFIYISSGISCWDAKRP